MFPLLPGSIEIACICSTFHAKGRKPGPCTLGPLPSTQLGLWAR